MSSVREVSHFSIFNPQETNPSEGTSITKLLTASKYIKGIKSICPNHIEFKVDSDKRGTELYVNKLLEASAGNTFSFSFDEASQCITVSTLNETTEPLIEALRFAHNKLKKYHEYKVLIAKFTPGAPNRSFPGYSFEDYDFGGR